MNAPELNVGVVVICWHRMSERRDDNPEKQVFTLDEARRIVQPQGAMDWMANAAYHAVYERPGSGFEVRADGVTRTTGRTMGELRQALKEFKEAPPVEGPSSESNVARMMVSLGGAIEQACEALQVLAIAGDADPGSETLATARRVARRYDIEADADTGLAEYAQQTQPALLAFTLSELRRHLEEVRARKLEGMAGFFHLWVE